MTGHQDGPDLTGRRRVGALRADLGLSLVPPHVAAELETITTLAYTKVELRLRSALPRYATLPPDRRDRLLRAVNQAMEEFACVVADRPVSTPTVDLVLIEIAREVDQPERFLIALHTALEQVRSAMRSAWPYLPRTRPYSRRLETALARYVERLCERTINALHPPTPEPPGPGKADEARLARLFAQAERQWSNKPARLCLGISPLTPNDTTPAARRHPVTVARQNPPGPLGLRLDDHLVAIAEHQAPNPQAAQVTRPTRSTGALCVGPFSVSELPAAYEITLLRLRLVDAGVAAPPPPTLLPLPNLGFLHTSPTEATVATIAELLAPLMTQTVNRRATLGRTLQLRLQITGTAQALANQRGLHSHTVHNHLAELDKLYDNHHLDITTNTFAIQAALAIVLPLWQLEAAGRPDGSSAHPAS